LRHVQFHPNGKHEKTNADLTKKPERFKGGGSEDEMESTWSEEPEKRWTQQDASNHFTDHGRLSDAEEKAARNAGGSNDNEELKKEPTQCTRAILGQAVPSGV
jgi:hypothetical protein